MPVVLFQMQGGQLLIGRLHRIRFSTLSRCTGADVFHVIDSTVCPVPDLGVRPMAGVLVVPVNQVDGSIRAILQIDSAEPVVIGDQEIRSTATDESRTGLVELTDIDPVTMNVVHENLIAVLRGEVITKIDHRPTVGMSAPGGESICRSMWFVTPPGMILDLADVMQVISNRLDVFECVGIEVLTALPVIASPLDHVPQVRNDAGGDEGLATIIKVNTPRVTGSV